VNALALIIGFLGGVATPLGWYGAYVFLLVAACCLGIFFRRKTAPYLLVSICMFGAFLGVCRIESARDELPAAYVSLLETPVSLEGKVIADPDIRETNVRLTILVAVGEERAKVLAVAPLFPEVHYGEVIRVTGTLTRPEPFDTDSGRTFRYDSFLAKDGIYLLMQNAALEVVSPRSGVLDEIRGFFSDVKFIGIDSLAVALPEPQASLASGLVLGGKQGLGNELLDDFIVTGLVHIVVLSGYNVMIVAEAVFRLFTLFAKRYAALMAAVVIAAFVLTAGAGAASIRAGIMAGVALFARASNRTYDAFRALMAAAVLMLIANPFLLVDDPGFQLSFVATLGLIFGTPILEKRLSTIRPTFLREIMASTIAAQISVLPLLLYQNGLLSLIALPANVIVLPVVPLAMAFSAIAGLAGFLVPAVATIVGLPAYALLALIIVLVEASAALPLAAVTVPAFPFFVVVIAYAVLGWGVWRLYPKAT